MPDASEVLQLAVDRHCAGDLRQAEQLCLRVLASDPNNPDAHHRLGLVALAQGQTARAIQHLEKAVEQNGRSVAFRHHMGVAMRTAGRKQQAIDNFRLALAQQPGSVPILNDLGVVLREVGELVEAEACHREAIRLDPNMAAAHNNLGNLLQGRQDFSAALSSFAAAARLQPNVAEIHFNIGNCYKAQSVWPQAEAAYRQAAALRPQMAVAHHGLGAALAEQKRYAEAVISLREALRLNPDFLEAHSGLGAALQALGRPAEARPCFERALALRPNDATALYNMGTALFAESDYRAAESCFRRVIDLAPQVVKPYTALAQACEMLDHDAEAEACIEQALRIEPDDAPARFFRATYLLAHARWAPGWKDFEFRLKLPHVIKRSFREPRWDGSPLEGRELLVHAEYGLGDTLHFIRYLPLVEQLARPGHVHVEIQRPLIPLLSGSGFHDLIAAGDPLPRFDLQIAMMSLGEVFQTTLESIPLGVPYLAADARLTDDWRERLSDIEGLKVGIAWQGNPTYIGDRHRSISLARFAALAQLPHVKLISLQKNADGRGMAPVDDFPGTIVFSDLDEHGGAFMDTAAIMQNLDLVITSDTATAHLAGALGVKVWVALSKVPEWRWMLDREDSPWYPTARLFRQTTLDDWDEVFARMAAELATLTGDQGRTA